MYLLPFEEVPHLFIKSYLPISATIIYLFIMIAQVRKYYISKVLKSKLDGRSTFNFFHRVECICVKVDVQFTVLYMQFLNKRKIFCVAYAVFITF